MTPKTTASITKATATRTYYGIYACGTGLWDYDMVWGDWRRVYTDADDARHAVSRLQDLADADPDAPEGLEYYAVPIDPSDEIRDGETAAQHLAAGYADIIAGLP